LHGGAGSIPRTLLEERRAAYVEGLTSALEIGTGLLSQGGSALDAVEAVVKQLEDDPLFNAGRGSVFTHDGTIELDASIMDGRTLACGAVCGVKNIKNPICLARMVMKTSHIILSGAGAEQFAESMGVERCDSSYLHTDFRWLALQRAKQLDAVLVDHSRRAAVPADGDAKGTVGCVARDVDGNLAVATSTGGMTNKRWGRIGDSPIIGAGSYANNKTCAVSSTGLGEQFIRHVVAYDISALMEYCNLSLTRAAEKVVHEKLNKVPHPCARVYQPANT